MLYKGPAKNAKIGKSMADSEDEDISPLCGKPYFDFILGESNLEPKYMMVTSFLTPLSLNAPTQ